MDSAITAALIGAPVAVIAAGAAYAAGRLQARGTHRGAVDAVRREHQRNAYAVLLTAARDYHRSAAEEWASRQQPSPYAPSAQTTWIMNFAARTRVAAVPTDRVLEAAAVVDLEGPDHVSLAAGELRRQVEAVQAPDDTSQALRNLDQSIVDFTLAARKHLNGVE